MNLFLALTLKLKLSFKTIICIPKHYLTTATNGSILISAFTAKVTKISGNGFFTIQTWQTNALILRRIDVFDN
jgi:hypothetical protein